MATDKRARQKANREAKRLEELKIQRRERAIRTGRRIAIYAAVVLLILVLANIVFGGGSDGTATTTTTTPQTTSTSTTVADSTTSTQALGGLVRL